MKRITLLIIIAIALMPRFVAAQESYDAWFEQANAAYNEGNYQSALDLYNNIVEAEQESVPLYFNLGNTYYKMGTYPMAIYYYEKALKLDPSNADVKTNLEIANLAIADKIESIPQSFIVKGWNNVKNMFSSNAWATVSVICFTILLAALFLFLRARRMGLRKVGFFVGILALLVFVFSFIFSMEKRNEAKEKNHAIIMTPAVTVKSSPNDGSVDLFVLHEGTKVTLLDETDGWNKVRIANGSEGWLPSDASLAY
ncbi:MAG: tetratricopeptide repeat protein [Bacteroidales bacterium]|nr:tetratricopeptide repeat protein [Bacteroidales bacterium]